MPARPFAVRGDARIRTDDPTQGIKLPRAKTDGIYTWSEDDIAAFEATHPIGSKARLAFALLLYTAQRRADVIRMGPQHVRDGVLTVRQQKTGTTLAIPVHSDLRVILDATPGSHLTFLTTSLGAYTANNFTEQFRKWCDAAGLPKHARRTACARPPVVGSPRLAARPTKSHRSAATPACARSSGTPERWIRRTWRATRWRAGANVRATTECQKSTPFDNWRELPLER